MFSKVLVANRGEIAVRVIRALEELGVASVAVYSEADRHAIHVERADEAYLLGPAPASESYLVVEKILDVAKQSGAEAVHPGYGFLAENAAFARACEEAGIVFIGPPADAIDAMGSKTKARELMAAAGVPIVPGTTEPVESIEDAQKIIEETIGYPVAVKAAGGGGGKGFRVALSEDELKEAFEGAAREGEKFFSDATVYLERYLPDPRHVEVQVLADAHGNVIHLGERDCSVQRRHQKLIEESPAPAVDSKLRARIGEIATEAARAVGYRSAGTIEGLLQDGEYYFLEMNTRVQVEHCVTEMTTGIDIVKEQIRIAAGEKLSVSQSKVSLRGHAIECRINAEDASKNFAPAPGTIGAYDEPAGPGVRVDSGVRAGSEISPMYDPMVAKLIVWDVDREQATARMLRALREFQIDGLKSLLPFHIALMQTAQWANGETCRDLVEDKAWLKELAFPKPEKPAEGDEEEAKAEQTYTVEVSGKRFDVRVIGTAPAAAAANGAGTGGRRRRRAQARAARARQRRRRRRRRHAHLADAGHRAQGRRRAGRRRGGGRADLRDRGHEDGERDHRPQGGDRRRAARRGRRLGGLGRHARRHQGRRAGAQPMDYEAMAAALGQAIPFNVHVGLEVAELEPGRGVVKLPDAPNLHNHVGSQHAGALFAAGEAASGGALLATFADMLAEVTPLAQSAEISYRKIARGAITATGRFTQDRDAIARRARARGPRALPDRGRADRPRGHVVAEMTVHWYVKSERRVSTRAWVAEPHEAEIVARLLIEFRDWYGRDWPSDNAFLAGVERLIERTDTEYLLATPDDDSPPAGVCQLRYRWGIWLAAEDCWLEDLYVRDDARRTGVGSALVELAIGRARERGCRRVELDVSHDQRRRQGAVRAPRLLGRLQGARAQRADGPAPRRRGRLDEQGHAGGREPQRPDDVRERGDPRGEVPALELEAPDELQGADHQQRSDDDPDDADPARDDGGLDERDAGEQAPRAGQPVAQMLTDCDAEVAVQRLEDDVDRLPAGGARRRVGVHAREQRHRQRPADEPQRLHERGEDPDGDRHGDQSPVRPVGGAAEQDHRRREDHRRHRKRPPDQDQRRAAGAEAVEHLGRRLAQHVGVVEARRQQPEEHVEGDRQRDQQDAGGGGGAHGRANAIGPANPGCIRG